MDILEQMSSPTAKVVDAFGGAVNKIVNPLRDLFTTKDPIELLVNQHQEFKALAATFKQLGEKAHRSRAKVVGQMIDLIKLHSELEEKFFYPHAERMNVERTLEGIEEHSNVDHMITRLKRTKPEDKSFGPKVETFRELIDHHAGEEERVLFPECRSSFSAELKETIFLNMTRYMNKKSAASKSKVKSAKKSAHAKPKSSRQSKAKARSSVH